MVRVADDAAAVAIVGVATVPLIVLLAMVTTEARSDATAIAKREITADRAVDNHYVPGSL
jgi:hypothetical protein